MIIGTHDTNQPLNPDLERELRTLLIVAQDSNFWRASKLIEALLQAGNAGRQVMK